MAEIQVTGLRELQAALRQMDADLPKMMRTVNNEAAGLVVDYARPRMPSKSGAARGSLKVRSSQRESRIAMGGRKAPYAPWLDFGGQGRRAGRPPSRPFVAEGRYVYAALRARRTDVIEVMAAGMTALAVGAGLEVS